MRLEELICQLTAAAKTRGRKTLHAGPFVVAALAEATPAASPSYPPGAVGGLALLTEVEIYQDPEMGDRDFRLVHHDACDVDPVRQEVYHGRCAVTAVGELSTGTSHNRKD